ncbi:hypothetical protein CFP56_031615 [Quercus suber]|uniref:Zinc knuckle CX2CX4HX4C domain-containing protein n=1 Tax=Quercus suber TaxID=58331 RepID=A0AAW0JKZ3_QUESU
MEDDVINILENMKLTSDEEEVISISDEGRKVEIESYSLSLIGKFLTCRAPFDMVSPPFAEAVGERLGVVEEVKKRRKQDIPNFFMNVKVALPLSKPLRRGAFLVGLNGQKSWVTFKYERLALFCHYCGLLGHDLRHCA